MSIIDDFFPMTDGRKKIKAHCAPLAVSCGGPYDSLLMPRQVKGVYFHADYMDSVLVSPKTVVYWATSGGYGPVFRGAFLVFWDNDGVNFGYMNTSYPDVHFYPTSRRFDEVCTYIYRASVTSNERMRLKMFRGLFHAVGEIMPCHATVIASVEAKYAETRRAYA